MKEGNWKFHGGGGPGEIQIKNSASTVRYVQVCNISRCPCLISTTEFLGGPGSGSCGMSYFCKMQLNLMWATLPGAAQSAKR